MSLANYSDLQTAVGDWMARSDLSGSAADLILLAEARLNREIPAVETDSTLTGTLDSRRIDISAESCVAPIALFLVESSGDERELLQKADGTFPYASSSGVPRYWAIDGTNIDFDCPLDDAYTFRFRFRQKFALATSSTNWLLTEHPDVYLAAVIVWSGGFVRDTETMALFKGALDEGIQSVKHVIMEMNRGTLTVDPALGTRRSFDWFNSQ